MKSTEEVRKARRESVKNWKEKHPEKMKILQQRRADRWRQSEKRPEATRKATLKKYGITPQQYNQILLSQGGGCAICKGRPKLKEALPVDHCHTTGRVRGLLCSNCNRGLGCFKDSPALLVAAVSYLKVT